MKNIQYYRILIIGLMLVLGCSKDDDNKTVNLKAVLSMESNHVGSTEGEYIYINLSLSKSLSEDLVLKGHFSTDGIDAYINDNDYSKNLEYSNNGGRDWKKEPKSNQVKFAKETTSMKIRIATVDDQAVETVEKVQLTLTPFNADRFTLENKLSKIHIAVLDNEKQEKHDRSTDYSIIHFRINDDYANYSIANVTNKVQSRFEKEVVDGLYKQPIDDAMKMLKLLPKDVKVIKIIFFAETDNIRGGYVRNTLKEKGGDSWVIGINIYKAFYDELGGKMEYNSNGHYGNIFVHELGHILTLNQTLQLEKLSKGEKCKNYSGSQGCSKSDAYTNLFHKQFYLSTNANPPTHVSGYAKNNLEEDIAETFTHYITQENIPSSTHKSSGALQKLNFIHSKAELASLKSNIRKIFTTLAHLPPSENINSRLTGTNEKPKSCLE